MTFEYPPLRFVNPMNLRQVRDSLKWRIRLYQALYHDKRTPRLAKVLFWLALGYFFLPFGLIPDFIPVLGQLDDLIIVPSLIFFALKLIPKELYLEHSNAIYYKYPPDRV